MYTMPNGSPTQLRAIWQAAGRPGQAKLRHAATRKGLNATDKQAADLVRSQRVPHLFTAAPVSEGNVTSHEFDERWQSDLIDVMANTPTKSGGHRLNSAGLRTPRSSRQRGSGGIPEYSWLLFGWL